MGHAASILTDDTPIFKISEENPNFADLGVLGSMELLDTMGDDLSIVNAVNSKTSSTPT
jgi:hypothetical protein